MNDGDDDDGAQMYGIDWLNQQIENEMLIDTSGDYEYTITDDDNVDQIPPGTPLSYVPLLRWIDHRRIDYWLPRNIQRPPLPPTRANAKCEKTRND